MNALPEIETAIKQLPENDVRQLARWLQNYLNEKWDRQMEADGFGNRKIRCSDC